MSTLDLTIDAAPRRRPGRWAAAGVVVLLVVLLGCSALTNPRYQWDVVRDWFTARTIVTGLLVTLQLTAISMAIGIVLAVMRGSANRVLSSSAATFNGLLDNVLAALALEPARAERIVERNRAAMHAGWGLFADWVASLDGRVEAPPDGHSARVRPAPAPAGIGRDLRPAAPGGLDAAGPWRVLRLRGLRAPQRRPRP
jgi:hypothetical protein